MVEFKIPKDLMSDLKDACRDHEKKLGYSLGNRIRFQVPNSEVIYKTRKK